MRKSKELKRTRKEAGVQYRKGDMKAAYKLWGDAAKGYKERLEKRKAKAAGASAKPAEAAPAS